MYKKYKIFFRDVIQYPLPPRAVASQGTKPPEKNFAPSLPTKSGHQLVIKKGKITRNKTLHDNQLTPRIRFPVL